MVKDSLFSRLLKGDAKNCFPYLEKALSGGQDLVYYLDEILFAAASIKYENIDNQHPIMTINSIKNIIGDNKANPSQSLMKYCLDICLDNEIVDYNDSLDDQYSGETISSVFVGTLEDAIQSGSWDEVDQIMPKIYYASDRSRSIIDTIADLGLQNIDSNGSMIFHLLRAFNFKQSKSNVWTYSSCLINVLKKEPLPRPSKRRNTNPIDLIKYISSHNNIDDIITYSAVLRIWEGDYVRLSSYQREISCWLDVKFPDITESDKNKHPELSEGDFKQNDFIQIAELIISKNNSIEEKSRDIIALDALRYLKNKSGDSLHFQIKDLLKA